MSRPQNTYLQHLTPLRARSSLNSRDFHLLCELRTVIRPFYTANLFKGSTIAIMSTLTR